jgi:hypothetical protein
MAVADEYQTQKIFGFDEAFAKCGYENIPDGQRSRKPFVGVIDQPARSTLVVANGE